MFGAIAKWFGAGSGSQGAARDNRTRLGVEGLETRECPASLAVRARSVVAETVRDARELVKYVAVAEYYSPTIARDAIDQDLVGLNNAANARNAEAVFVGTAQLLAHLSLEAQVASAYGIYQTSPLAYQAIGDDFKELLVTDRAAEQRIILAAERTHQPVVRVQVQRQFHAPISSTAASIQASQQKVAQLNALQNASGAYYSNAWVA